MPTKEKKPANKPAPATSPPDLESGDSFTDVTFENLSLEAADLSEKDFVQCTFRNCKLPESRWRKSRLEDCLFEGCDLSRMNPEKLALRSVTFKDTRMWGVDWSELANFPAFSFEQCDLRYSSFVKLELPQMRFVDCRLEEVNFIEVDLTEADFSGASLLGSTLQGCSLAKTNFTRASGVLFNPLENRVKGARLSTEVAVALAEALGCVVE